MKTAYKRSSQSLIPPYSENGALQLIVVTGVTFIAFHFSRVVMLILGQDKLEVFGKMFPNFGLSTLQLFRHKAWTLLTYGWLHHGFFDWVTNMVWAYCFASVLQGLAGYRQVLPLFFYALLMGGGCYLASQFAGGSFFVPAGEYYMGAQAGVIALGFAAFTLAPRYRLHLTPQFSIPLAAILGVYVLLDLVVYLPGRGNALMLCLGGAVTGFGFGMLLRKGLRPAEWIYDIFEQLQQRFTPDEAEITERKSRKRVEILRTLYEPKRGISQERIDEILDKINEGGYHTLSREEKDILLRAGKD